MKCSNRKSDIKYERQSKLGKKHNAVTFSYYLATDIMIVVFD